MAVVQETHLGGNLAESIASNLVLARTLCLALF